MTRVNTQQPGSNYGQFNVGSPIYRTYPSNVNGQPARNNPIYEPKYFDNHYIGTSQMPNNSNPNYVNYPYNSSRFNGEPSVFVNAQTINNTEDAYKNKSMKSWKVVDVVKFVSKSIAHAFQDDFNAQLIDGKALKLIKVQHLTLVMGMPLGTAVKFIQEVDGIKKRERMNMGPSQ